MKTKPKDHRSHLAKARGDYIASQGDTEEYWLNRLEDAWLAGAKWGRRHPVKKKETK